MKSDDWGSIPKSGPHNISGTWGGAFGNVIYKKVDTSISTWVWKVERVGLVQFVPIAKDINMLVWSPKSPKIDFDLFTRNMTRGLLFYQTVLL